MRAAKTLIALPMTKAPHRRCGARKEAQIKEPYLLVALADFELVFAVALALDWVNSLAA